MQQKIRDAAAIICQSELTLALTGAGISVESGIPDFRSPGGLWERFDPIEYGTISAFRTDPEKVWTMIQEVSDLITQAHPNPAHIGLGTLQQMGLLHTIITQNIDSLHQKGGATRVIEYHGQSRTLSCLWCNGQFSADAVGEELPPRCSCGKILKPDVIFFGEPIPQGALRESFILASSCRALLVIGTSAEVTPANTIPQLAKAAGAKIVEINIAPTLLTHELTDIFLQGTASEMVTKLVVEAERSQSEPK
jgi:NAD-dependent deacetylase